MLLYFKQRISAVASTHSERLLNTEGNGCVPKPYTLNPTP
jgi:hypothetical protein